MTQSAMSLANPPLMIACGALARELRVVLTASDLANTIEVSYLPANLHNSPSDIVPTLRPMIAAAIARDRPVFVGYSDCGTGGLLDAMLAEFPGVNRLPGAHCYEMFAGAECFAELHEAVPGTFYLTDFLALHFDALVWAGLGLDRHPELRGIYFGNYTRVVHLAQGNECQSATAARGAADRLGLPLVTAAVGRDALRRVVEQHYGSA